ncbi:MAG: cytochrome b N-terminal domain-containing protein [Calditrichaceae bacterium]
MDRSIFFEKNLWMPGWGEISLSSLVLALISGLLLIPVYISGEDPFRSISQFISDGYMGVFLHGFHSYAGDIFLISTIIHVIEYLLKKSYQSYTLKSWGLLIILFIISILTIFSGFLSIGSKESFSAVHIFDGILQTLPVIGNTLSNFLLQSDRSETPLAVIYTHHAATFSILSVILTYVHIRRLKSERYAFVYTIIVISFFTIVFPVKLGFRPDAVIEVVKGPWYFIGLQELLAWLPVSIAGLVFPSLILIALYLLPAAKKLEKSVLYFILLMIIIYMIESIIGTYFRGDGWQFLSR